MACCALALVGLGCAKFQQVRECGSFVQVVNSWLARQSADAGADAGALLEPKAVAEESRRTAQSYQDLARSLSDLHVESEELVPRVQRYESIANAATRILRDVAQALDRGDLDRARQKRVEFDGVAEQEAPLVKEINGLCR